LPLVLRVATAVDVGAAAVALVVILVNVSVVDVHVGRMCIATVPGRAPRVGGLTPAHPRTAKGQLATGLLDTCLMLPGRSPTRRQCKWTASGLQRTLCG